MVRLYRLLSRFVLLLPLLLLLPMLPFGTVAAEDVHLYIGPSIDADDAMHIREGIRLGQHYVQDDIGIEMETPTIVNAVPAEPRGNVELVGLSTSHAVVVFTGSGGWEQSAPFDRVHVVVHEYMHVVQQELAGERSDAPLWIDEGIAEYVGFQAVIDAGLVPADDVDAYNRMLVVIDSPLPPLEDLERISDYQAQSPSVYGLSYLAVKQLVGDRPSSIQRYYERLGSGSWRSAFQSAFGMNPREFYEAFEASRADIVAPFEWPETFTPVDEVDIPADVALDEAPASIKRGEQLLVRADTIAGARCSMTVETRAGRALLDQPTFADATGALFWLWTIPADARRASVTASIACGGEPVTTPLAIE